MAEPIDFESFWKRNVHCCSTSRPCRPGGRLAARPQHAPDGRHKPSRLLIGSKHGTKSRRGRGTLLVPSLDLGTKMEASVPGDRGEKVGVEHGQPLQLVHLDALPALSLPPHVARCALLSSPTSWSRGPCQCLRPWRSPPTQPSVSKLVGGNFVRPDPPFQVSFC